jgi:hypothetical protein
MEREMSPVQANLHYFKANGHKPYRYNYDPPENVARTNAEEDVRRAAISNLRPLASQLSLDEQGAALRSH